MEEVKVTFDGIEVEVQFRDGRLLISLDEISDELVKSIEVWHHREQLWGIDGPPE